MVDARDWTARLVAVLDLPANYTMQSFVWQADQSVLASQSVPNGDAKDIWISKHVDGRHVGTMVAPGGGHGAVLGTLGQDRLLFDYAAALVAAPWKVGTVTVDSPGVTYRWGGSLQNGNVHAVTDLQHGTVLLYNSDSKVGTLRTLDDIDAGINRPVGSCLFGNKDSAGVTRLRQGWAVWDGQAFGLVGDATGGQEVIAYNLATGAEQWRRPVRFTDYDWEEPEGLFVLPPIAGEPGLLVGATCRVPTGDSFVRRHVIHQLRDPAARLPTDLGWMHTAADCDGYTGDGQLRVVRGPGVNLWVSHVATLFGIDWAVTTFGTHYPLHRLAAGRAPSS